MPAEILPRPEIIRPLLRQLYTSAETRVSSRALTPPERQAVLTVLQEPRFADLAPAQAYAKRIDDARYLCSSRTMYRVQLRADEVRERARDASYAAPELLATGPNQLWSWDITKLHGSATGHRPRTRAATHRW